MIIAIIFMGSSSCGNLHSGKGSKTASEQSNDTIIQQEENEESSVINALLVSPLNPSPGEVFHVLAVGGRKIAKADLTIEGGTGTIESTGSRSGNGLPYWRIDAFTAGSAGEYKASLETESGTTIHFEFTVSDKSKGSTGEGVWKTVRDWDPKMEALYAAWVNALFYDASESTSWKALNEVTQNPNQNFLYNALSLGEDDPASKIKVLMSPDCADNPYYLRAYFSWKVGLPFGYHESDRGNLSRAPKTGAWITNGSGGSKTNTIQAFNSFVRRVMNGVHSGSARTALNDNTSDYYPVALTRDALRPGTVFADPYGHTLILVRWIPQTRDKPGILLSVDAQPDGTVGIKRFWKGNFLFTTSEVIGEPGFKNFRPIITKNGVRQALKNNELNEKSGFTPFSVQQGKMSSEVFYHTMDRNINPKPLDPEMAMLDLIQALHEQLTVRITSVANGEEYMQSHPGAVVPMPGTDAGVFQAGGQWEDFSTPNRDLRMLIAMDAIMDFPDKIVKSPDDYKIPLLKSPEDVKKDLEELLSKKLNELTITYTRTNNTKQTLTLAELLKRRAAFEMAYNPNDGIEIRWGAPENSEERSTCRRHVPANQMQKMKSVRRWFQKRLHPPT